MERVVMFSHLNKKFFAYAISVSLLLVHLTSCSRDEESKKMHGEIELSMLNIVASDKKYEGSKVRTIAYVNIDKGELVAYPYRASYEARDDLVSLKLDLSFEDAERLSKAYKDHYCVISGTLIYDKDGKYLDKKRLGKLTDVKIITNADYSRKVDRGSNQIMLEIEPPRININN